MANLSFSAFQTYDQCPYRYNQCYLKYVREPGNRYTLYGIAFHTLLDSMYAKENFTVLSALQSWVPILNKEFLKKKYSRITKSEFKEVEKQGVREIEVFFELARRESLLHPALEHELSIEGNYQKHILKAKIDLVTTIKGGVGVLDWKTGKPEEKNLMQLALYAALYMKKTDINISWLVPVYIKTNEVVYQPFDEGIKRKAGIYFRNIYNELINDNKYLPKKNKNCYFCMFNKNGTCPLFKRIF